ncbi:two-component system response regulator [Thermohalobacter berrensis]|uniref:Two-component system response regulator n=2 Tax=Thermohalobacter berrensis TaxID=99594 RepID=A0A419T9T1_9FIRM|nr:two-component system response regulator [Thermohalobacter berrensis]
MRLMLSKILREAGFEVVGEASNGKEGIKKFKELNPDLVTLDITMPEMDGIQVTREIRKLSSQTKIVICSAMGENDLVTEAIQAGANDFIIKPFEVDRVLNAVKKLMS